MMNFRPYSIKSIEWLSKHVVAIQIERSDADINPGQHIVIQFSNGNKTVNRPCSVASSTFDESHWRLLLNCQPKGELISYLRTLSVGDALHCSVPYGMFYADVQATETTTYLMVAGDMGIAPLISMAKSVLQGDATSTVHFIYHVLRRVDILLERELNDLLKDFSGRFFLTFSIEKTSLLKAFSKSIGWEGELSAQKITDYLQANDLSEGQMEIFTAGSAHVVDVVKTILPTAQYQYFHLDPTQNNLPLGQAATIKMLPENKVMSCRENQTLLSALLEQNTNAPHSCTQGICGTCAAKLISGEVHHGVAHALTADDRTAGYILTCQAVPASDDVTIEFVD